MSAMPEIATQAIVVDEVFPHAASTLWRVLTDGSLMERWLMAPKDFAPVAGTAFTFQTTPGGAWDGVIHCEVLDVLPHKRLSYSWRSGHEDNVGYGSRLDSLVTWLLDAAEGGTRLRLIHSGFVLPRNETVFEKMRAAWPKVVGKLGDVSADN